MPPRKVLRWTQFPSDANSHGASHRTLQIRELCEDAGFQVEDIAEKASGDSRLSLWLRGLRWIRPGGATVSHLRYGPGLAGYHDALFSRAFRGFSGTKVALWESTQNRIFPALARAHGYRVLALPHNIETLGADHAAPDLAGTAALASEIGRLASADAVFAIAREEQWLLRAFGIECGYLPYHPPRPVAARLGIVRSRREGQGRRRSALVLGNALHPLTADGMRAAIRESLPSLPPGFVLDVAGFGTERLRSDFQSPRVTVHGAVSPDRLDDLMTGAAVLIACQIRGAGALTRIPEALLAGVPVLANSVAARSTAGLAGVHVFDDFAALRGLIEADLPGPPAPLEPTQAYRIFQRTLCSMAENSAEGRR